jgi:hypothetical protein
MTKSAQSRHLHACQENRMERVCSVLETFHIARFAIAIVIGFFSCGKSALNTVCSVYLLNEQKTNKVSNRWQQNGLLACCPRRCSNILACRKTTLDSKQCCRDVKGMETVQCWISYLKVLRMVSIKIQVTGPSGRTFCLCFTRYARVSCYDQNTCRLPGQPQFDTEWTGKKTFALLALVGTSTLS